MQIGGLMGFVLLLLVISYIIIHRDAKNIKRYKRKTTDLIELENIKSLDPLLYSKLTHQKNIRIK